MKNICILFFTAISLTNAYNTAVQDFANSNNLFAQDVYKHLAQTKHGNFLVSPFSAEIALMFVQSGCKGKSAWEIRNALHIPNEKYRVEYAIVTLLSQMKSNEQYTLQTANKMYLKENFPIKNKFKHAASLVYQADLESINFLNNVDAAKSMNDWVEKQTNDKIKNLINSDDLNVYTRAVLINALYFKANWTLPFYHQYTNILNFYKTPMDIVQVETLWHYEVYFNYHECPYLRAQILELPFKGNEARMVIVLPYEKHGLWLLESQLDRIFASHDQLQVTPVTVALPKFNIKTSVDIKETLLKLGVEQVFDAEKADLSNIAGMKGDLYINKVFQNTFIDVSEEGVEAAASTVAEFHLQGVRPPANLKYFIADHPFIFFIKVNDIIVFAGRVTDPSSK